MFIWENNGQVQPSCVLMSETCIPNAFACDADSWCSYNKPSISLWPLTGLNSCQWQLGPRMLRLFFGSGVIRGIHQKHQETRLDYMGVQVGRHEIHISFACGQAQLFRENMRKYRNSMESPSFECNNHWFPQDEFSDM